MLISGRTNVGKTSVCNELHNKIDADPSFTVHDKQDWYALDFFAHYEKNDRHIVLNTPSDDDNCMIYFCEYLDSLTKQKVRPDIIITTIRERNMKLNQMSHMLALLDAIGKGTKNLTNYFNRNIAGKSSFAPTTLNHHAFMLHLKRQKPKGSQAVHNKMLTQYRDNNADIMKHMLDFAIIRL